MKPPMGGPRIGAASPGQVIARTVEAHSSGVNLFYEPNRKHISPAEIAFVGWFPSRELATKAATADDVPVAWRGVLKPVSTSYDGMSAEDENRWEDANLRDPEL